MRTVVAGWGISRDALERITSCLSGYMKREGVTIVRPLRRSPGEPVIAGSRNARANGNTAGGRFLRKER